MSVYIALIMLILLIFNTSIRKLYIILFFKYLNISYFYCDLIIHSKNQTLILSL